MHTLKPNTEYKRLIKCMLDLARCRREEKGYVFCATLNRYRKPGIYNFDSVRLGIPTLYKYRPKINYNTVMFFDPHNYDARQGMLDKALLDVEARLLVTKIEIK